MSDFIRVTDHSAYVAEYQSLLQAAELQAFVDAFEAILRDARENDKAIYFAGNGASAAIASHLANDVTKALKIRAHVFHDPAHLTCFANDFGYENWLLEAVGHYGRAGDIVAFISSSGRSKNIVKGLSRAQELGLATVALVGPEPSPELLDVSELVYSVKSKFYNIIECIHMIALTSAIDRIYAARL